MSGVEILNETAIATNSVGAVIVIVIGAIILVGSLIVSVDSCLDGDLLPVLIGIFPLVISGLYIGMGITKLNQPTETHYQVLVDESVPLNEFYEKYEVIGVDGKIYTIKEKTSNE